MTRSSSNKKRRKPPRTVRKARVVAKKAKKGVARGVEGVVKRVAGKNPKGKSRAPRKKEDRGGERQAQPPARVTLPKDWIEHAMNHKVHVSEKHKNIVKELLKRGKVGNEFTIKSLLMRDPRIAAIYHDPIFAIALHYHPKLLKDAGFDERALETTKENPLETARENLRLALLNTHDYLERMDGGGLRQKIGGRYVWERGKYIPHEHATVIAMFGEREWFPWGEMSEDERKRALEFAQVHHGRQLEMYQKELGLKREAKSV